MYVRWIAVSAFVALASTARAQSPAVLGKQDAEFAMALKRAGYTDLAERLVATIEKAGKATPEESITLKALHLDLRLDLALREVDPYKEKDLLRTILQEKEDFVRSYSGRPIAEEVRNSLPDIYRLMGDSISSAIAKEKDPALIAQLQKEGSETYTKAEDALAARIKELQEKDDSGSDETVAALLPLRFNLPRMMYFHALLYPKEEFRRKDLLNKAITGFQEFGLDYNGYLNNYEALILEGLCHKELEDLATAKDAFKEAFKFPEALLEKNSKGYYDLSKDMADTVSEAGLQWMNLLMAEKDYAGALAIAKEYIDTTPGAYETRRGLAILAVKAEAHLALNDTKSAGEAADKLVEEDPRGPWGSKGREIQGRLLGGGDSVDPSRAFAIARSTADRGDDVKAVQLTRQALVAYRGHAKEAEEAPGAWMFLGSLYMKRGQDHEAALAFDTGADLYPNSKSAPELVYLAIGRYIDINKAEKRPYYKKRIDDRTKVLATKYADSDVAQGAKILEGDAALAEGRTLDAADLYSKVLPSSKRYLEAQGKAAETYLFYAVSLANSKKDAEAKPYFTQAENLYKKVIADADKAGQDTLAFDEKARFEAVGRVSRIRLAELYDKTDRPQLTLEVIEGTDERYASNADALSIFWTMRISALQKLGRTDEAIAKLDALAKKDPKSKAISSAAFVVARSLDQQSADFLKAGKKREAEDALRKAAGYYAMAGRALLANDNPNIDRVVEIANRLLSLGLDQNGVPENQSTFVGWDPKATKTTELYQLAGDLFTAALERKPSSKGRASLGRIYGFLGKFEKAAEQYAAVFDSEALLVSSDKSGSKDKRLNMGLAKNNPYLVEALFEWGVVENFLAGPQNDRERFRRAQEIFDALRKSYTANGWGWWQANYYSIKNKADLGEYVAAKADLNDLERTTNDLGAQFGLADEFAALKERLKDK